MLDEVIEAAVRETYAAYLEDFQRADAAVAVQAYFQLPCLMLSPAGDTVIVSTDGLKHLFAAMKARLAALDYARSEVRDMSVKAMADNLAAVSLVAVRYNSTGREIERLGAFYLMRRIEGHWRFVQLAMHDAGRKMRLA